MTRGDERAPIAGRIDHVIFGNVHEQGLRPVASSFEHRDDLDWAASNLDRFVGLESFLEQAPPTTAFSYVRFRTDMAAAIRRHDDGTGSRGRSRADILVGDPDCLGPEITLGLDRLDEVWGMEVPSDGSLRQVDTNKLWREAENELRIIREKRREVRDHALQVLAAMGTFPKDRYLLVGAEEHVKKALLLAILDARRLDPHHFGTGNLSYSTYEAHSQDVQGAPQIVFVPGYPDRATRRKFVDLTGRSRRGDPPSEEMLARADEALARLLGDRPALSSTATTSTSTGTARRPELINVGGRATQALPSDPARGSSPPSHPDPEPAGLPYTYAGGSARMARSDGGRADGRPPERDEPPREESAGATNEWVDALLAAQTSEEFRAACIKMKSDLRYPKGRRTALTPPNLLKVYQRGVNLPSATGGRPDPVDDLVLALPFGNSYAELDRPGGLEYLVGLVRASTGNSAYDLDGVKGLIAVVVQRFRERRKGDSKLARALTNDYFDSLGLDPLKDGWPASLLGRLRVGHDSGRRLLQLGSDLPEVWTPFQREGKPTAVPGRPDATPKKNKRSLGLVVISVAVLVAAVAFGLMLVQTNNDEDLVPGSPAPTAAQSAGTTSAEAEPVDEPAAGSLTQPIKVQLKDLKPTARAALPPEAKGQVAGAVVYVVWRSNPVGSVAFGQPCVLDWSTGAPTAYVCPVQPASTMAAAAGDMIVVASTQTLFDKKDDPLIQEGLNDAGLIDGMTPLTEPVAYP
jgi:hypothetical protein